MQSMPKILVDSFEWTKADFLKFTFKKNEYYIIIIQTV